MTPTDSDAGRGTSLGAAIVTARTLGSLSSVEIDAGTYDLGALSPVSIDLGGSGVAPVNLRGVSRSGCVLTNASSQSSNTPLVVPGTAATISSLTINSDSTNSQPAIGSRSASSQAAFQDAVVRDCDIFGYDDGAFIFHDTVCSWAFYNCLIESTFDCLAQSGVSADPAHSTDFHSCQFSCVAGGNGQANCFAAYDGFIRAFGCTMTATGSATSAAPTTCVTCYDGAYVQLDDCALTASNDDTTDAVYGVFTDNADAVVRMNRGSITVTAVGGGDAYDLINGSGSLTVAGTAYALTFGSITTVDPAARREANALAHRRFRGLFSNRTGA